MFKVGDIVTYETFDSNARLEGVIVEVDENDYYQTYHVEGPYNRNRYWPCTATVRLIDEEDEAPDEMVINCMSSDELMVSLRSIYDNLFEGIVGAANQSHTDWLMLLESAREDLSNLLNKLDGG